MEQRFKALRTIAILLKVVAWLVLVLGLLFSLVILLVSGMSPDDVRQASPEADIFARIIVAGFMLVGFFAYWLILYALAEGILVILAIEENTRRTALELVRHSQPSG